MKLWGKLSVGFWLVIADHFLHSDFDEIVDRVNTFMETK